MSELTRVLTAIEQGDAMATDELLPLVYNELRRLAAHKMSSEAEGQTLQPTALVHEAWLKLVDSPAQSWQNCAHFFGAAAEAMRRILIARARRKQAQRRGSGARHLDVDEIEISRIEKPRGRLEAFRWLGPSIQGEMPVSISSAHIGAFHISRTASSRVRAAEMASASSASLCSNRPISSGCT